MAGTESVIGLPTSQIYRKDKVTTASSLLSGHRLKPRHTVSQALLDASSSPTGYQRMNPSVTVLCQ